MPDALYFTEDEAANHLLAKDPFALLVGFALDQQVTVQQAFLGPLRLKQRLGTLDPSAVAEVDLQPIFREAPPTSHPPRSASRACPGFGQKKINALAPLREKRFDAASPTNFIFISPKPG